MRAASDEVSVLVLRDFVFSVLQTYTGAPLHQRLTGFRGLGFRM